jgi:hypothetical protein
MTFELCSFMNPHGTLVHRCWLLLESVNAVGGLLGGEDQRHEDRIMKHDAVVKVNEGCPSPRHRQQIAWLLLLLPSCRPSRRLTARWIPTFWLLAALAAGRLS